MLLAGLCMQRPLAVAALLTLLLLAVIAHVAKFEAAATYARLRFRNKSAVSRDAFRTDDCAFAANVLFIDLFGSSSSTPWLLCGVESAMEKAENSDVIVMTNDLEKFATVWPVGLPNPSREISVAACLEGTPLHAWLQSEELHASEFRQQNIANALRMAALYKSGGTYLDLDVIALKHDLFKPGLAAISKQCSPEDCGEDYFLNNAFLSFPAKDPFLHQLMEAFVLQYEGKRLLCLQITCKTYICLNHHIDSAHLIKLCVASICIAASISLQPACWT